MLDGADHVQRGGAWGNHGSNTLKASDCYRLESSLPADLSYSHRRIYILRTAKAQAL